MTPKGQFIVDNRKAIERAGRAIEREMNSRGFNVQTSTGFLVAIHACAAFADIPEIPAREALENIRRGLAEHDSDCLHHRGLGCDCGAEAFSDIKGANNG